MPSLIGNKPNQVPTNGDLGTLAFQDANAVNITGGVVDVSAGTAALPTLGTTGDENTGVFFPAADTVAVSTNGTERMRITSAGNVGIGTSSPNSTLEVNGEIRVTRVSVNTQYLKLYANVSGTFIEGVSASGNAKPLSIQTDTNSTLLNLTTVAAQPIIFNTTNTERMRLDASGNLGLGVTPSAWATNRPAFEQIGGSVWSFGTGNFYALQNLYFDNVGYKYTNTLAASSYQQGSGIHYWYNAPSGTAGTAATLSERMRLDASGNLGIGVTSVGARLDVRGTNVALASDGLARIGADSSGADTGGQITFNNSTARRAAIAGRQESTDALAGYLQFGTRGSSGDIIERMRINSVGDVFVAKTAQNIANVGCELRAVGMGTFSNSGDVGLVVNRNTNDGDLVLFRQDNTTEGTISVSGTTVSYNGGHLSRWSQLPNGSKDETLLKGTVLSNLDDMCVWEKDGVVADNEQLNKMKVSDVEGDTNVAGVFVNWTMDEQYGVDDMNVAMTGDMIIRIADGVVVQKGDLLMSAGDGTAKPQSDDIVRSKTIAKVTSNHVTCTYADGSYCVPCILMAC